MRLFAETLSPSAAIIRLVYLLEEHTCSLLCSSSAAQKAQPGELSSPASLPSWADTSLLHNSVFPAAPHTFLNFSSHHVLCVPALDSAVGSAKRKGINSQVRYDRAAAPLPVGNTLQPALCAWQSGVFSPQLLFRGDAYASLIIPAGC